MIIYARGLHSRYLSRFFDYLAHPNLIAKFSRVPFTIALIHFGKRYEDYVRAIFDQWPKLHIGLDALSNQKFLKGS